MLDEGVPVEVRSPHRRISILAAGEPTRVAGGQHVADEFRHRFAGVWYKLSAKWVLSGKKPRAAQDPRARVATQLIVIISSAPWFERSEPSLDSITGIRCWTFLRATRTKIKDRRWAGCSDP